MRILGLGGSTAAKSTSALLLQKALAEAERHGAETVRFLAADIDFPLYTDDTPRSPAVTAFLSEVKACDGIIVVSPAFHGTVSGRIKNALDYVEDLKADGYLNGRVFGSVGVGGGHLAAILTLDTLRNIACALRAWPTPMGLGISSNEPITEKVDAKLCEIVRQVMSRGAVQQ